jgi:hypothetical protein
VRAVIWNGPGDELQAEFARVQLPIASARHLSATRMFAVDRETLRLDKARPEQGEPADFSAEDPVEA